MLRLYLRRGKLVREDYDDLQLTVGGFVHPAAQWSWITAPTHSCSAPGQISMISCVVCAKYRLRQLSSMPESTVPDVMALLKALAEGYNKVYTVARGILAGGTAIKD
jgi:hypothetical protein